MIDDVLRAMTGDRAAFDRLVRSHQDAAVAYAAALLGSTNFDLARDAAQEAFVDAWLHLGALREPRAFRTWLRRIIRKHCDRLTRGAHAPVVSLDAAAATAAAPASSDPALVAEVKDTDRRVRATVSGLPAAERAVMLLYYIDSHSHADIAAFLGIAAKTVKSRLHTARGHLRERMKHMIHDETTAFVENSLETLGAGAKPSRDDAFAQRVATLIHAIESRDDAAVKNLIAASPALANARTPRPFWEGQVRALHAAVEAGQVEAARSLIDAGADVNASTDKHQWRPLHLALSGGSAELVSLLIAAGATVDVFAASGLGNVTRLRELLAADSTLARASGGPDGATPLHFAADAIVAEILLSAGADINARDAFHACTPLAWLTSGGKRELASFLLTRGASTDLWIDCALDLCDPLAVILAENPALATAPSPERNVLRAGFTAYPLHFAARYGSVEAAGVLLRSGADIAARSSDGSLPIHDAAYRGHSAMIEFLLENGSPINDREHTYQSTPLGLAEYANRAEAAAYLRSRGGGA